MNEQRFFSTQQAAEYLGITVSTVKYHIYTAGDLKPDAKVGQALVFTRETLNDFQTRKRPAGRPPSAPAITP